MFHSKSNGAKIEAVIGPDTEIEGHIRSSASIRVDGKIKGNVTAESVVIGASGLILGDVQANNVTISGKVKGNIHSAALLELLATGQILGDIKTSKLTIADGGTFEGNCQMIRGDGKVIEVNSDHDDSAYHDGNHSKTLKVIGAATGKK